MPTEQEREWLRDRPAYTSDPLTRNEYYYFEDKCRDWAETNYEPADWLNVLYRDGIIDDVLYKDAAEFEAKVVACVAMLKHSNHCQLCPMDGEEQCLKSFRRLSGLSCHDDKASAWLNIKRARLSVEEEMENERLR